MECVFPKALWGPQAHKAKLFCLHRGHSVECCSHTVRLFCSTSQGALEWTETEDGSASPGCALAIHLRLDEQRCVRDAAGAVVVPRAAFLSAVASRL